MITRRNFFKLAGISAAALGAGYSTGKLVSAQPGWRFSVHGFLPNDEQLMKRLAALFRKKVKSSSQAMYYGSPRIKQLLQNSDKAGVTSGFGRKGTIIYHVQNVDHQLSSDLIISDDKNPLYSLEDDFSNSFLQLRNDIKKIPASYYFSAEYKEEGLLNNLLTPSANIIIENEKGTAEVLKAGSNYSDIVVEGAVGKTHVAMSGGIARVTRSCCKNRICEHTILSGPQQIIACAPNKIIIRHES